MLSELTTSKEKRLLRPSQGAYWLPTVSDDIKALAEAMTDPDIDMRPSIEEVLDHDWLL